MNNARTIVGTSLAVATIIIPLQMTGARMVVIEQQRAWSYLHNNIGYDNKNKPKQANLKIETNQHE